MARIRTIKPDFPHSESMGKISRDARLLFLMLWTIADDSGRLRGNSRILASLLFPYDDDASDNMDCWINELERVGSITRYTVEDSTYIQIANWLKHQKIDKPSQSKIPEIPRGFESIREDSRGFVSGLEGTGRELEKEVEGNNKDIIPARSEKKSLRAEKPKAYRLTFDYASGQFSGELEAIGNVWAEAYPAVDIAAEILKAKSWMLSNPANKKSNIPRFLASWLSRAQDRASNANLPRNAPVTFAEQSRKNTDSVIEKLRKEAENGQLS